VRRPFEDVEPEVAAVLDPLVVPLGEHSTDEADRGVTVGKMPTTSVQQRISWLRRSWEPDLRLQSQDLSAAVGVGPGEVLARLRRQ